MEAHLLVLRVADGHVAIECECAENERGAHLEKKLLFSFSSSCTSSKFSSFRGLGGGLILSLNLEDDVGLGSAGGLGVRSRSRTAEEASRLALWFQRKAGFRGNRTLLDISMTK